MTEPNASPRAQAESALHRRDAAALRTVLENNPDLRAMINAPAFPFNSPAIVAFAGDASMVEVLLDFGADPNSRSDWWAGGFHALHSATPAAAERLIAAGAIPDACAAAHLDDIPLLKRMISENPACVNERGGDGQTPLHFAVSRATIDLLLDAGADINARDVDHRSTPAEWMLDQKRGAGRYDLARYLVERGASTDIFLASALGLTDTVREMVVSDPTILDQRTGRGDYGEKPPSSYHMYFWTIGDARSPLDVAAQFEQRDTLDAILEFASPIQRFLLACRTVDRPEARSLLSSNPDLIETMTVGDHRAVSDAAWNGNARAVELMLELGFDPRTPGHDSGSALHCAAWDGSVDTVKVILHHPDARQLVHISDPHYNATPLGWCCHGSRFGNTNHDHAGVARLLLDAGALVPDSADASPAVMAVLASQ